MKKLKKRDFKKLALMGITGGAMLASQASVAHEINHNSMDNLFAGGGCSGKSGCNHGNISYRDMPHSCAAQQPSYYTETPAPRPSSSCASRSSCAGQSGQTAYYPQQQQMQQNRGYTQWEIADAPRTQGQMTEAELLSQLNEKGKADYRALVDTYGKEGKDLALKLASQDSYTDKNLAVKAAAMKMAEKRKSSSPR